MFNNLSNNQRFILNLILWIVGFYIIAMFLGWIIKTSAVALINTFGMGYLVFAAKFFPATMLVILGWLGIDYMRERQLVRMLNLKGVEL
jgi:maltodextrin utilization protein YvdJ